MPLGMFQNPIPTLACAKTSGDNPCSYSNGCRDPGPQVAPEPALSPQKPGTQERIHTPRSSRVQHENFFSASEPAPQTPQFRPQKKAFPRASEREKSYWPSRSRKKLPKPASLPAAYAPYKRLTEMVRASPSGRRSDRD